MDFEKALKIKTEMGGIFIVDNIKYDLLVTPEDPIDFKDYCDQYNSLNFTDETSKEYCKNGRYEIRAIREDSGMLNWEYPELLPL